MWRGLFTAEENVEAMVDTWQRGYAVLTTPTAWFMWATQRTPIKRSVCEAWQW